MCVASLDKIPLFAPYAALLSVLLACLLLASLQQLPRRPPFKGSWQNGRHYRSFQSGTPVTVAQINKKCVGVPAVPPYTVRKHQENIATRYGIQKYFPPEDIQQAVNNGISEHWELAEYFQVPCAYIEEMIAYYRDARGSVFEPNPVISDCGMSATAETLAKIDEVGIKDICIDTPYLTEAQAQEALRIVQSMREAIRENA